MKGILLLLMSLCPRLGTGTFYFSEKMIEGESQDSFYGLIHAGKSEISMLVLYPDTQRYLIRADSVYMFQQDDTIVVYRKGLFSLLLDIEKSNYASWKKIRNGCVVVPRDTLFPDSVYIFGRSLVDSIRIIDKDSGADIFVKLMRSR